MNTYTITFEPKEHKFTLHSEAGERTIPGTTQLLKKHKIIPYGDFITPLMEQRMKQGTYAHSEFERVEKGTLNPLEMLCDEAGTFIGWYSALPCSPYAVEMMVHYQDVYAGIIDMLYVDKDGKYVLVDHKTGAYHESMVKWQMGLYCKALYEEGIVINRCECWCYKDKTIHIVPMLSDEDFNALMDAERNGKIYASGEIVTIDEATDNAVSKFESMLDEWQTLEQQYKAMEASVKMYKSALYEYMLKNGIELAENERVRLKLTKPTTTKTFDSKAFKAVHPDMYDMFLKEGSKAGYVTVTWRDAE